MAPPGRTIYASGMMESQVAIRCAKLENLLKIVMVRDRDKAKLLTPVNIRLLFTPFFSNAAL